MMIYNMFYSSNIFHISFRSLNGLKVFSMSRKSLNVSTRHHKNGFITNKQIDNFLADVSNINYINDESIINEIRNSFNLGLIEDKNDYTNSKFQIRLVDADSTMDIFSVENWLIFLIKLVHSIHQFRTKELIH